MSGNTWIPFLKRISSAPGVVGPLAASETILARMRSAFARVIWFLRHGEAEDTSPDFERELTPKGERQAADAGGGAAGSPSDAPSDGPFSDTYSAHACWASVSGVNSASVNPM